MRMRLIPAGAGNTGFIAAPPVRYPVHPRGRGEHAGKIATAIAGYGSSPRARGTAQMPLWILYPDSGSSPRARGTREAGRLAARIDPPVHPRGRGEHDNELIIVELEDVIPAPPRCRPRARGTQVVERAGHGFCRFIPAGAGNGGGRFRPRWCSCPGFPAGGPSGSGLGGYPPTHHRRVMQRLRAVHPRGRGEHWTHLCIAGALGSSPRARGTPVRVAFPRPSTGSSPRARGTRMAGVIVARRGRFIPAGAGNTP